MVLPRTCSLNKPQCHAQDKYTYALKIVFFVFFFTVRSENKNGGRKEEERKGEREGRKEKTEDKTPTTVGVIAEEFPLIV